MTILSRENRFMFIHLHKCGGTSVEKSYGEVAHWTDVILGSTKIGQLVHDLYRSQFSLFKHSSARDIFEVIGADDYKRMIGFALVRDPFEIIESFYTWIERIFRYHSRVSGEPINHIKRKIAGNLESAEQIHFAKWGASKAYARSASFADFVDYALKNSTLPLETMSRRLGIGTELEPRYIFPLDRMDQFWEALESHLGIPLARLHANASRKGAVYRWEQEHINKVTEVFRDDIERFGFDYQPTIRSQAINGQGKEK